MLNMENTQEIQFSKELVKQFNEFITRYPEGRKRSAVLSIMTLVQKEYGHLTVPLMDKIAEFLELEPIQIYELATFYTMFQLKPVGKYNLQFCHTESCCLRGAEDLIDYTLNKLNIKMGETTPDGLFTVQEVECLGACGYAPMMQVGEKYIEHLTKESIDEFIDSCRKEEE